MNTRRLLLGRGMLLAVGLLFPTAVLAQPAAPMQDTADEPFIGKFSVQAAAEYLDRRAHLVEQNCYACHSTFTYLPGRSVIDPLADEVMRSRILLERFMTMLLDPKQAPRIRTHHVPRVRILAAVELARHDAITTGKLAPITRQSLDTMWKLQQPDGGIDWIRVNEAPQAIDNWWPVAMMALGAGTAPEGYAQTEPARTAIEKLRGWFRGHPPSNLHERGLTLVAHAAVGGIVTDDARRQHIDAIFAAQHDDGGWSVTSLADWKRWDKKPLDPTFSDGYATGFLTYTLARSGVPSTEPRLRKAVAWLKSHQRQTGGWFTTTPSRKDRLASNTGTSFAVQALAACGEITTPKVTPRQFAEAHAVADKAIPAGVYLPNPVSKPVSPTLGVPPASGG